MKKIYCDYCEQEIINGDLAGDSPTFHAEFGGYDIELTIKQTIIGKKYIDLHRNCLLSIIKTITEKENTNDC